MRTATRLLPLPALLLAAQAPLAAQTQNPTAAQAPLAAQAKTPPAAQAQTLQQRIEAQFAAAVPGARFGMFVVDDSGRTIVAIAPDQRFVPASNTKVLTTAAAFAAMGDLTRPDTASGATVHLEGDDVVLTGRGDARMSSAADCTVDCLATLADAVAARTRRVRDVIGDARAFPDERWPQGMSWNNIPSPSGTAVAALVVDDNEARITVRAAATGTGAPAIEHDGYFTLDNRARTGPTLATPFAVDRLPLAQVLSISGALSAGTVRTVRLGVDDPAHYAAWRLRRLLEARGVRVRGTVRSRYRQPGEAAPPAVPAPLAALSPAPLADDVAIINKDSQNLHAELLRRRLGAVAGQGSVADGEAPIAAMMASAGVPRTAWDLSDGSGMSTYNRITPRAMVTLLGWIARQPWGEAWRATLPVAGTDGTLSRRFVGTPLAGRLSAKTGSLNQASALAGTLTAASGRRLTFAVYAADMPGGGSATAAMDAALVQVAAAN